MSLCGLRKGKLFGEVASYVDTSKPPGFTPLPQPSLAGWLLSAPFLLFTSPNGVWASISLLVYIFFPYDLSKSSPAFKGGPLSLAFFVQRLPFWLLLVFGYALFWHLSLYFVGLSSRPFIARRPYEVCKTAHNAFWSMWGVVLWVAFENVFCFLWATGRLPYVADRDSFGGSPAGAARFAVALLGIPLWRAIHFYFSHRFLHFGAMFQYVHSLHHRNTDVEPLAGLAMHPVEHIYYFACILPSLVFLCSPFAFLWNGVHLLLSPAASHSGWEDHFQGGSFHYMHHRYFDRNFAGADVAFLDVWFGSFAPSFEWSKSDKEKGVSLRDDPKSTLAGPPAGDFVAYLLLSLAPLAGWGWCAAGGAAAPTSATAAAQLALAAGLGPVAVAQLLAGLLGSTYTDPHKLSAWAWALHMVAGNACCTVPVVWACWLALAPPNASAAAFL
jgi:sterol desaturase/sphingolipid hydroxylase (fatty acid hydroxylase superfamily)